MELNKNLISTAYLTFLKEAPKQAEAWNGAVQGLAEASALDEKTRALAYISVLAALRLESGIPFHVIHAHKLGASKDEIISAILVGLPAAGNVVTQVIPSALSALEVYV